MTVSPRPKRPTRSTGVTLEIPVINYLREVAEKENRDRSFCINQIVREHAERNGQRLALAKPLPAPATTNPNDEER